jgi:phosphatidylglycerol:prolipoprotein diacylglycerol transferase
MIPLLAEIPFPGWDPVLLRLGPLQVRWYGLGYLAGFLVAGFVLDRLVKDGYLPLTKEKVSDFIGWLVVSVIVGGRLGYALFYEQRLLTHPLELIRIWEGGLSFHGGLAGVAVGSLWFARRQRVPWLRLGDGMALAIPFGILFVRCANFINGELYGRLASASVPWAMRFPTDPAARALSPELARGGGLNWHDAFERLQASGQWDAIARNVPLRHPSQLYEALLEGVVAAVVLWLVYRRGGAPVRRNGGLSGLFLVLYAGARIVVEFFREPDPQLGTVLGPFSMGQVLSAVMLAGGLYLLLRRSNERSKSSAAGL